MKITLTGADERTRVLDLISLSKLGVEIGLLYTASPDGRRRFPPLWWIATRVNAVPCAVHICGSRARAELCAGVLDYLLAPVHRIQINGNVAMNELLAVCRRLPTKTIITQHTAGNAHLVAADIPNHALLVDDSGGRGRLPGAWQRPETSKPVGFAGGLGPATLRSELPKVARVADGHSWVDMEASLRDVEDWFSFELAAKAVEVFRVWRGEEEARS